MQCVTLHEFRELKFDASSPFFDPDSLVRYDDHQDLLKGRPITVMVCPLLQGFGTDQGDDYDKDRVWAKGVVWLDSRVQLSLLQAARNLRPADRAFDFSKLPFKSLDVGLAS